MRRSDGGLQVGVGPGATVVQGSDDERTAAVVAGVLHPDPAAADGPARCPVVGHGPVATRLALTLAPSGPTDGRARLTVHVHQHVVPPDVGLAAARDGLLHLPVVVQSRRVVVGPLTGRPDDPCLHCLDRHRVDRDPGWPELSTWLGHPAQQVDPVPVPADVLAATEGVVLLLVRSALAGQFVTPGLSYEIGTRAPHVVVRTWRRHPACAWHPPPDRAVAAATSRVG